MPVNENAADKILKFIEFRSFLLLHCKCKALWFDWFLNKYSLSKFHLDMTSYLSAYYNSWFESDWQNSFTLCWYLIKLNIREDIIVYYQFLKELSEYYDKKPKRSKKSNRPCPLLKMLESLKNSLLLLYIIVITYILI